jgi:hypothetical protein
MIGLLQANSTKLLNGELFHYTIGVFEGAMPLPIFSLLVFGTIGVSYYMVQRSFVIPAIMFVLVCGVTITQVPLTIQRGIVSVLVIAMAAVGYRLLQKVRV